MSNIAYPGVALPGLALPGVITDSGGGTPPPPPGPASNHTALPGLAYPGLALPGLGGPGSTGQYLVTANTTQLAYRMQGSLFSKASQAWTVWRSSDGLWHTQMNPSADTVADAVFLCGTGVFTVDQTYGAELASQGFNAVPI